MRGRCEKKPGLRRVGTGLYVTGARERTRKGGRVGWNNRAFRGCEGGAELTCARARGSMCRGCEGGTASDVCACARCGL